MQPATDARHVFAGKLRYGSLRTTNGAPERRRRQPHSDHTAPVGRHDARARHRLRGTHDEKGEARPLHRTRLSGEERRAGSSAAGRVPPPSPRGAAHPRSRVTKLPPWPHPDIPRNAEIEDPPECPRRAHMGSSEDSPIGQAISRAGRSTLTQRSGPDNYSSPGDRPAPTNAHGGRRSLTDVIEANVGDHGSEVRGLTAVASKRVPGVPGPNADTESRDDRVRSSRCARRRMPRGSRPTRE